MKSERQARAESSKASKRAEAVERKAANAIAHAGRLEAAEAEASRLAGEVAAVALAAALALPGAAATSGEFGWGWRWGGGWGWG